jgi:hypothetical protein
LVQRYLDTTDRKLTSGLYQHAKICWGKEIIEHAVESQNIDEMHKVLKEAKLVDGRITAVFERTGKRKVTYSAHQHMRSETQYGSAFK